MQDEILDALRTPVFFVYISVLLTFCVVNGSQLGDRVELEFQAYRLQQYEVAGSLIGSKSFRVMYEAVSLDANALRKSTIASWRDLAKRDMSALFKTTVGAVIIIIPDDFAALSPADRIAFLEMEGELSSLSTELAVYAIKTSESTAALFNEVAATSTAAKGSSLQQIIHLITSNTFQLSSSSSSLPAPNANYQPKNVIARLSSGVHSSPTIAFIAHYDSHAVFPELALGADSNGSGVVALLELLAVLKKFYERPSTRPPYNIVFVWTAAGKFNYQGTMTYIQELQERNADDRLELAICLDSIGRKGLNVHVSKQPPNGSATDRLVKSIQFAAPNESIQVQVKKISINQPFAWEHERVNARRLPAVTMSSLSSHDALSRRSLLDTSLDIDALAKNIKYIGEAVLNLALSLPQLRVSDERVSADTSLLAPNAINKNRLFFLSRQFTSSARPMTDSAVIDKTAARISALASAYAPVKQQKVTLEAPIEASPPEKIVAEKVKAAIFDVLLSTVVAGYLALLVRISSSAHYIIEFSLVKIRKATC